MFGITVGADTTPRQLRLAKHKVRRIRIDIDRHAALPGGNLKAIESDRVPGRTLYREHPGIKAERFCRLDRARC